MSTEIQALFDELCEGMKFLPNLGIIQGFAEFRVYFEDGKWKWMVVDREGNNPLYVPEDDPLRTPR